MSHYISNHLRLLVCKRAFHTCEYCLTHEDDTYYTCPIDHIISLKHGGLTTEDNLAFTCVFCNRNKGSDIASFVNDPSEVVRFYNPRTDLWLDHFRVDGHLITGITDIGEVTIKILEINNLQRVLERKALILTSEFPHPMARKLINLK